MLEGPDLHGWMDGVLEDIRRLITKLVDDC